MPNITTTKVAVLEDNTRIEHIQEAEDDDEGLDTSEVTISNLNGSPGKLIIKCADYCDAECVFDALAEAESIQVVDNSKVWPDALTLRHVKPL